MIFRMQFWLELKLRDNMIILTLTLEPHTFHFTKLVQKLEHQLFDNESEWDHFLFTSIVGL